MFSRFVSCTSASPNKPSGCSGPCELRPGPPFWRGSDPPPTATRRFGTRPRHLDLFRRLPDSVLDFLVDAGRDVGLGISTIEIRYWGRAMSKPGPDAGPIGHRDARFSVIADTAEPALAETFRPHATGGSFLNFLSDPGRAAAADTRSDYRRLREVKASYDPDDVFRRGHRIPPLPPTASIGYRMRAA